MDIRKLIKEEIDNYNELSNEEHDFACYILENSSFTYKNETMVFEEVSNILSEAEYQGRKVKLGKIMRGDVKKFKVYVINDKGNVVKVNFGDPNMRIKKYIPARRKSFRARHRCETPGPKWKARYWACRTW